ncbi:hypothetical protein [Arthrobacter sp. Leaf141]|uniref:hypothetical protein n=1 Tax=Arthrobacter sp. Leaf141 TaxID=1736273 RepID=UPI001F17B990|nr:hypothetical protein [Arthrobacter sp. Leaf141]
MGKNRNQRTTVGSRAKLADTQPTAAGGPGAASAAGAPGGSPASAGARLPVEAGQQPQKAGGRHAAPGIHDETAAEGTALPGRNPRHAGASEGTGAQAGPGPAPAMAGGNGPAADAPGPGGPPRAGGKLQALRRLFSHSRRVRAAAKALSRALAESREVSSWPGDRLMVGAEISDRVELLTRRLKLETEAHHRFAEPFRSPGGSRSIPAL